jgi:hypothetical protein
MFSSDPFQRLTAGGTFNRTFTIFAQRFDLFLIISGIIFVPLALMFVSLSKFLGSSMQTMFEAMNSLDTTNSGGSNRNLEDGAYDNSNSNNYYDNSSSSNVDINVDNSNYDSNYDSASAFSANSDPMTDAFVSNMSIFGTQFVLEYLALLLFAIAGKAAMAYAVAEMYAGRDPTWLNCLKKGFSRWCDVFGSAMLVSVAVFGCNIVFQLVIAVMAATGYKFMYFLCFLVMVAWTVFLTFVMVSLMILAPVIMVEGNGPIRSIKRCWELSWNNRCYIFCTIFCMCMLYYVVQLVLTGILYSISTELVATTGGAILVILPALLYIPLAVM